MSIPGTETLNHNMLRNEGGWARFIHDALRKSEAHSLTYLSREETGKVVRVHRPCRFLLFSLQIKMAKWGEGDPRWIVEERADAKNVNNWHW